MLFIKIIDPIAARQHAIGLVYKSTELEATRLDQQVQELKRRIQVEKEKKQKMQAILLRYRDVDQDISGMPLSILVSFLLTFIRPCWWTYRLEFNSRRRHYCIERCRKNPSY